MSDPLAELSSLATALDEMAVRVAAIAEADSGTDDSVAFDLFEIERSLKGAQRRLAKLLESRARR